MTWTQLNRYVSLRCDAKLRSGIPVRVWKKCRPLGGYGFYPMLINQLKCRILQSHALNNFNSYNFHKVVFISHIPFTVEYMFVSGFLLMYAAQKIAVSSPLIQVRRRHPRCFEDNVRILQSSVIRF